MERIPEILPPVTGPTWIVVASGPSLTHEDAQLLRGCGAKILAINLAVEKVPFAHALYASDPPFWQEYHRRLRWFRGERLSIGQVSAYGVRQLETRGGPPTRDAIYLGGLTDRNSGLQGVSLAYTRGARTIALLGHDGQFAADGRRHCHEDHRSPLGNAGAVKNWPDAYTRLYDYLTADGVRLINCTRTTAHTWPRVRLEDFLEELRGN